MRFYISGRRTLPFVDDAAGRIRVSAYFGLCSKDEVTHGGTVPAPTVFSRYSLRIQSVRDTAK
jgi:hypothetical protein